ncbi:ATP-binding protein [Streptomyces sp. HD]|uniref:ATP-binding protein n=1 Tax=Streptomyces sp. HD TaxID=3020892 RepID=UPI00232EAF64|nr:ATP-binding protein [Streptomyces sp. HD]MDC0771520.1 ATP-binding protein [Streptomyces sp. HD]
MSSAPGIPSAPCSRALRERAAQDDFAPLYGREAEEAALVHMTVRLRGGTPGVTVIHGSPGSGRTRLLRRGLALARALGVQVLTAQGSATPSPDPYTFVRQLRLPRPTTTGPSLAAGAPTEGSVQGWCRALLSTAHRPTLLALDDVQWADPESVQVIAGLLRRLASAPLGVLLTVTSARGEFPDACAELIDQAAAFKGGTELRLELGPLGVPEVRAMCAASGLPVPAASDGIWWEGAARLSHGSPWLLRRVLNELRREPGELHATGLRTAFTAGIAAARAARAAESAAKLAAGPLALLRGLTVCRGLVAVDRVAALVGLDETELPGALRTLRVQGLIDFGDPPRLRLTDGTATVLVGMDGDERRRLQVEAARWAHRCDADEEVLAALLLNTVALGEPWVPSVLRRTARTRLERDHHTKAAELLERALREPLPPAVRAEVLLEAAEVYTMAAPEAADHRIAELLSGTQARPRVRTAARDLLLARGEPSSALNVPVVVYGNDRAASADVPRDVRLRPSDVVQRPGSTAQDAGAALHGPPDPDVDPAALAAAAWRRTMRCDDVAEVQEMCRQVLRAPLDGALLPRFTACCVLSLADAHGTARSALDATLAEAGHRRSPALVALGLLVRADLNLRAGDADTAAHDLAACRSLAPPEVWHPSRLAMLRATQIRLLVVRERYEEADRLAGEKLPLGAEESSAWGHVLYARAQLLLCRGHPRQALAAAEECGRRLAALEWGNPALMAWRSLAALALRGCGDHDRAAVLFAEESRLAERWGTDSTLAWTELRQSLGSLTPQAARLTARDLRRLGPAPAARRLVQGVVAREMAGSRHGARADTAAPASVPRDGRNPVNP